MSDGFHLLRLEQRFAGFLQRARRVHSFGDVSGDFGKTDKRSVGTVNGVDKDMGKKLRPVLANTPTLFLEPSLSRRNLKRMLRQAGLPILLGIEAGEVLPDNFFGRISLDPLRTGIPA